MIADLLFCKNQHLNQNKKAMEHNSIACRYND